MPGRTIFTNLSKNIFCSGPISVDPICPQIRNFYFKVQTRKHTKDRRACDIYRLRTFVSVLKQKQPVKLERACENDGGLLRNPASETGASACSRVHSEATRRRRKGGWYGWKPSSSSNFSIRNLRAYPLVLKFDKQFPVEQFEARVSQSKVPSPLLRPALARATVREPPLHHKLCPVNPHTKKSANYKNPQTQHGWVQISAKFPMDLGVLPLIA